MANYCNLICRDRGYPQTMNGSLGKTHYWCGLCGRAIPQEDTVEKNERLRCPCCLAQVRLKSHYKNKWRDEESAICCVNEEATLKAGATAPSANTHIFGVPGVDALFLKKMFYMKSVRGVHVALASWKLEITQQNEDFSEDRIYGRELPIFCEGCL